MFPLLRTDPERAAWITLDGPERRNALDVQAARDLARQMGSLARNPKES